MLYKYCNTNGYDILLKSRLKISKIDSFNDPFELNFGIDKDNARKSINDEFYDNLYKYDVLSTVQDLLNKHSI